MLDNSKILGNIFYLFFVIQEVDYIYIELVDRREWKIKVYSGFGLLLVVFCKMIL